jgi:hypothetical protein
MTLVDSDAGPVVDPNHPIPSLGTLDVLLESDSAARVGIIIASPMTYDSVSRARFESKLKTCFSYFNSPKFLSRWGNPTPANAKLYIDIHAGSDPAMIEEVLAAEGRIKSQNMLPVIGLLSAN